MILNDKEIKKQCIDNNMIVGWQERYQYTIKTSAMQIALSGGLSYHSYDVSLRGVKPMLDINKREIPNRYLASTVESFNLPKNVTGTLYNKSTLARLGIKQPQTIIEAGWSGRSLTLEIELPSTFECNEGLKWLEDNKGMPIASIMFQFVEPAEKGSYAGKYQGQGEDGSVVGAR